MASPHYPSALLSQSQSQPRAHFTHPPPVYLPLDRSLPSRHTITESTLPDAYATFILYCNPHFPQDIDTTTLRTNFLVPPKSDGKQFTTWNLWSLLKLLDAKEELKTWGELAVRLGVEPPDVSKGQSAQKIQQYTVRLKRWMRAMHIDAFFEYLLGKQHSYYLQIPFPDDPYPAEGRDGVPVEEDTAVRALDPRWKPKRGRRRNSETTEGQAEEGEGKFAAFAADEAAASAYPRSAVPQSAHPDGMHGADPWAAATSAVAPHSFAPWAGSQQQHTGAPQSAITPSVPHHLRWQHLNMTPSTPHPMSAHPRGSMAGHMDALFDANEPRSAITPSSKRRRKHGPAVSSAWPSSNAPGAKPKGRPPAAATARSAHPDNASQFGSFPANPNPRPRSIEPSPGPDLDSIAATPEDVQMPPPPSASAPPQAPARPGRLSLQVPQHMGGPVRLATPPPPQVIVSEEAASMDSDHVAHSQSQARSVRSDPPKFALHGDSSNLTFEALKRALTTSLLRTEIINRPSRPRLAAVEAKGLADAMLSRLSMPRADTDSPMRDHVARLSAASWLGLGDSLGIPPGPAVASSRKLQVMRFRTDEEGYEEIVDASHNAEENDPERIREVYDMYWTAGMGSSTGNFSLTGLSVAPLDQRIQQQGDESSIHDLILDKVIEASKQLRHPPDEGVLAQRTRRNLEHPDPGIRNAMGAGLSGGGLGREDEGNIDWRARAMAMEFGSRVARGELERYKQRVLEEVLEVLL